MGACALERGSVPRRAPGMPSTMPGVPAASSPIAHVRAGPPAAAFPDAAVPAAAFPDAAFARAFRDRLGAWFARHGRRLAFRTRADPWAVLVAEVMAQQTQVGRVEPAWTAFMARFPTPATLAAASPADVLRAWAGMGYNRRALDLRRAAARIEGLHGGVTPRTIAELEALPGVGPYTARAVSAIAFGVPVAAVDTNVRRVIGRVVTGHGAVADAGSPLPARALQAVADTLVDPADPARWTHAMMDLGASCCRPAVPRCADCPLAPLCRRHALTAVIPPPGSTRTGSTPPSPTARRSDAPPSPRPAFPETRRWLRGRILARLRELPDGAWTVIAGRIGTHDGPAVEMAVAMLVGEGMVERRSDGSVRLPSAP